MVYALVILSCLGSDCRRDVVADGFGMMGCLQQSQSIAAQWQAYYPDRKIKQIRCVDIKRLPFELGRDMA
ncbi:hypothetical protein [Mesorhizobium sp.]|uniref:hypothetical protein n=1 Tax=Mesorhizobium sp. TaxID=1871066 RepID=UPI0025F0B446|nr:hypothetical protein [Mesorhizobium sp.]